MEHKLKLEMEKKSQEQAAGARRERVSFASEHPPGMESLPRPEVGTGLSGGGVNLGTVTRDLGTLNLETMAGGIGANDSGNRAAQNAYVDDEESSIDSRSVADTPIASTPRQGTAHDTMGQYAVSGHSAEKMHLNAVQAVKLLQDAKDVPLTINDAWQKATQFRSLLKELSPDPGRIYSMVDARNASRVASEHPKLHMIVSKFLGIWRKELEGLELDIHALPDWAYLDTLRELALNAAHLMPKKSYTRDSNEKSRVLRYDKEKDYPADTNKETKAILITALRKTGDDSLVTIAIRVLEAKSDPSGKTPHSRSVDDAEVLSARYERFFADTKAANYALTSSANKFPKPPPQLSSDDKEEVSAAWERYRPQITQYIRAHVRYGSLRIEFLLNLHKDLTTSIAPCPPGITAVMDKAMEQFREDQSHPLHEYFPLMMDIILCKLDVHFSMQGPDDSPELHKWTMCKKREIGDHCPSLILDRVMHIFLKKENAMPHNKDKPLTESDLPKRPDLMREVTECAHTVMANDEANPTRGREMSTRFDMAIQMAKTKYTRYAREDDTSLEKRMAAEEYSITHVGRYHLKDYESAYQHLWKDDFRTVNGKSRQRGREERPKGDALPASNATAKFTGAPIHSPGKDPIPQSEAQKYLSRYGEHRKKLVEANDTVLVNVVDQYTADVRSRSDMKPLKQPTQQGGAPSGANRFQQPPMQQGGAPPGTGRFPQPPTQQGRQFGPPSTYPNQQRTDGYRQVSPPEGSKGNPRQENWTLEGWRYSGMPAKAAELGTPSFRIDWDHLENLSRQSDRLKAIACRIRPSNAECNVLSGNDNQQCKIYRDPPQQKPDGTLKFDWAVHTCKGCCYRPQPPTGTPQSSPDHPENYAYGNGNGAHSINACLATRRLICEGGVPAVKDLPMFLSQPVTDEEIKAIQACLMISRQ